MAQANWVGLTITMDDLTASGDLLWDTATEGFTPPVGVKFTNTGSKSLYLHIPGFHYHPDDGDQTDWTFTLLPAGQSIEIFSRYPGKHTGGLKKAYAWVESGFTSTLVWTPTMYLSGGI
jgi:hypothetical protein